MERIQSAIEKARARRQSGGAPGTPRPAINRPTAKDAVRTAWQAVPEFMPQPAQMERSRILTFGAGAEKAPFDMMRTRILQQMRANDWRRLAITSPGGACGKTTLCLNLAFSLARQSGERTLAIELDMRRPSFARLLGTPNGGQDFSQVLDGTDGPARHMWRYHDNVAFGIVGKPVRNSAELLQNQTAKHALEDLERVYDPTVMLFDMPPMMLCDDMLAFSGNVDCVLLVAAAERSTVKEIDECERELAGRTNVLGVVLNKCRYTPGEYDGYYE